MVRATHIGIAAVSAEGAALLGEHCHPQITMHTYPLSEYMRHLYADRWDDAAELLLASAGVLAGAGAEILICPANTLHQEIIRALGERGCDAVVLGCTEIPLLVSDADSPLPALDSTRILARAALRAATAGEHS